MMFTRGMDVVCIDDDWRFDPMIQPWPPRPRKGGIYRVVYLDVEDGELFLALEEFPNPAVDCLYLYAATFFRPVTRTDISVFTAMLAPLPVVPQPERVDS